MRFIMATGFAVALVLGATTLSARANSIDEDTQTECKGTRCVGSYCSQDGNSRMCWKESVLIRKPGEEVHWVCMREHHRCKWVHGPMPEGDDWNKFTLEP